MTKNLLPIGFYDLIFDEAQDERKRVNLALDFFMENKYRLIKTPLIEFGDGFLGDSFSLVDAISGKNLALRNDITLQIARLVATKFDSSDFPLKLCYVGDVLLPKSNELYADRQSTQVGLEIIGCKADSHFEIIAIILQILPAILAKKITIEFSLPNFSELLCEELKIAQNPELIAAIGGKNISAIRNLCDENVAELICEIALRNHDLRYLADLICQKIESREIAGKLQKALEIEAFMAENFAGVEVCFDLFGDAKNSYHKEIAFDVFCEGFSYPIVRGGKYQVNDFDAVGATIYMNYLRKI